MMKQTNTKVNDKEISVVKTLIVITLLFLILIVSFKFYTERVRNEDKGIPVRTIIEDNTNTTQQDLTQNPNQEQDTGEHHYYVI